MKKTSALIVYSVMFFTIKSFGGNHTSTRNKSAVAFPVDTTKKAAVSDTAKKDNDTADDDEKDNVRSYAIELDAGNDQSSHGVHSNSRSPYIEPNFTYTDPKGFYTVVQDYYYFMGKGKGYNIFGINPGWNIDVTDDATWNINLTHNFLGSSAARKLPSQDISNIPETYFSQDIGETEGKFTIDYDFYSKTSRIQTANDWIFTPDLNHTFKIKLGKKSSLKLIPEASYDFGTRNGAYHFEANNNETIETPSKQQLKNGTITQSASFGSVDYNLIFSTDLKIHNFEFGPAINLTRPLYVIPGQSTKAYGYVTLSLIYTIY